MQDLFTIVLVSAAISTLINVFLKKFHIPTIIGYIFTGLVVSYSFGLSSSHNQTLSHIAEFGIVFLMFTIGLEFSLKHLFAMKKEVFLFGFFQVFITGNIFGAIIHELFGAQLKSAIIIGFALALSSTAIVLKMLNESGDINSGYGRKSLGILLFQDIAVIPILLMIGIFANKDANVSELLLKTFIHAIILLVLMFFGGKYLLNKTLEEITKTKSKEIFIAFVLLIALSSSYLAHSLGFSYSLGAFLAGMLIAETRYKYQVEADISPFRDLLLGVFFITVGMQINVSVIAENILTVLGMLVLIMGLKLFLILGIVFLFAQKRTAIKTAFALSQVGEFALAIFEMASSSGLLSKELHQPLIVVVVLSMISTPFILRNLKKIADIFAKDGIGEEYIVQAKSLNNHIVVCGYGKLGKSVCALLKNYGFSYVVVEHDAKLVDEGRACGEPIVFGNAAQTKILENLYIKNAVATIVAIDNEHKMRLVCEAISSIAASINTVVKVADEKEMEILEGLHNINHIIVEGDEMAKLIVAQALKCQI